MPGSCREALMAKVKNLDVWIIESNAVYQRVPFTVVTDWITQGRLLAEDKIRPVGTEDWFPISKVKQLAAYLPRPEAPRAEDEAEALEPVAFELTYNRPRTEPEDDVDMIPLIDVSLVLLIYFMMILAASNPVMAVVLPLTKEGLKWREENGVTLIIDYKNDQTRYGLMKGKETLLRNVEDADEVVRVAKTVFDDLPDKVNLTINADATVPSGQVNDIISRLTIVPEIKKKIAEMYFGTGEKKP
jgi:biopolymer transport protein ExbD